MSFFYECTIPFNGIQQAIRVIHLCRADSLLEKRERGPRYRQSAYAPDKGPPPYTHASCTLKSATEVMQKLSVCSL